MHMDIAGEFPDGLKKTDEEVVAYIRDLDYDAASQKCKAYMEKYIQHAGHATEACITRIKELMGMGQ